MTKLRVCLFVVLFAASAPAGAGEDAPVTIFVARKIVTMDRRQPAATAVAVAGDRILAVGTLDEVQLATRTRKPIIDRTFADKVLLPGFVAVVNKAEGATRQAGVTTVAEIASSGAIDSSLDALAKLQKGKRREDHRFTVASSEKWSAAQCERLAKLGGLAAIDPREASGSGTLIKNKVPLALRSAKEPAAPLSLASELSGGGDRVSVIEALRTVTIDAAFVLRKEKEIGSIAPGKKADFAVLEQDPLGVSLSHLKDVAVWGTVSEGKKQPIRQAVGWGDRPKRLVDRPSGTTPRHGFGLLGDDLDPRRNGKCDPSCPCRGGPRAKTTPFNQSDPRRGTR